MFHFSLLASYSGVTEIDGEERFLYGDVWTEYASNLLTQVFMYAAIALAVALIATGAFVRFKRKESFKTFLKTAVAVVLTFTITVILTMLSIGFAKISEKGYAESGDMLLELVPPLVSGGVVVLGIIAAYVASFFSKKAYKITLITVISVIAASLIATIVCLAVYYSRAIADDGYYDSEVYGKLNQGALYGSAAALVVAAVVAAFVLDRKNKTAFDSKCIALAGICVALSFALSYIRMFNLPQGGSITLASMLPVMLFAYVYGPKKGLIVGLIYGTLQAMQDAYVIHPAQFLLDYPIAFAMTGFAGVFKNLKALDKAPQVKFALGAALSGALRYLSHLLSGVFAFGAYAVDAGQNNFWLYSSVYNCFVFVDVAIVIAVGVLLFSSKSFNKQISLYGAKRVKPAPAAETEIVGQPEEK